MKEENGSRTGCYYPNSRKYQKLPWLEPWNNEMVARVCSQVPRHAPTLKKQKNTGVITKAFNRYISGGPRFLSIKLTVYWGLLRPARTVYLNNTRKQIHLEDEWFKKGNKSDSNVMLDCDKRLLLINHPMHLLIKRQSGIKSHLLEGRPATSAASIISIKVRKNLGRATASSRALQVNRYLWLLETGSAENFIECSENTRRQGGGRSR